MSKIKGILGKLFAGPLLDLIEKLSGEEGMEWLAALEKFLRKENPWEKVATKVGNFLKKILTIVVPATAEPFDIEKKFVKNLDRDATLKVAFVSDDFQSSFYGKTEDPVVESILNCYKLKKPANDREIIGELGGEDKVGTTMAEVFHLMTAQGRGQKGKLLVNDYANIFYVRDKAGRLCAVNVHWYVDGWNVYALSLDDASWWDDGCQVFSRN